MVRIFLCGDVMLGRGVDQVLPHPGAPDLRESYVRDARDYVRLVEAASGPLPRPTGFDWVWGGVPGMLDLGRSGLADTLAHLAVAGLRTVGAGADLTAAQRPAAVPIPGGRVLVLAVGTPSSGIPSSWAATGHSSGVNLLREVSTTAADDLVAQVDRIRQPADVVVVSVHWGGNWGHDIPDEHVRFAHRLVDGGVDVVHGHSSHHPRAVELYRGRPVLYGCGDFVDDYEGIGGHAEYRDELRLAYLITLDRDGGRPADLRMVPLRSRRMRLVDATGDDAAWLRETLDRVSRPFGHAVVRAPDGALVLAEPGTGTG